MKLRKRGKATLYFVVSGFLLAGSQAVFAQQAQSIPSGVPLQVEIEKLERFKNNRPLFQEERHRLAQLYFLRSDCVKVNEVLADKKVEPLSGPERDLACACDGKCDLSLALDNKGRFEEKLYALRQLLTGGASLQDAHLQKIWISIKNEPEARYAVFSSLRGSQIRETRALANEPLHQLSTLNVEP